MELLDKNSQPKNSLSPQKTSKRGKTALRMSYETEVELIRRKIGTIDHIRQHLGLSRRKMCQLLLVDPSTWTRWNHHPEQIPPHIYRSLQWYLALIEKYPEWHPKNTYLGAFRETQHQMQKMEKQWEGKLQENLSLHREQSLKKEELTPLYEKNRLLNDQLTSLTQFQRTWKFLLLTHTIILIFLCWKAGFSL